MHAAVLPHALAATAANGRDLRARARARTRSPPLSLLATFDILSVVTVCLNWDTCLFSLVFLPYFFQAKPAAYTITSAISAPSTRPSRPSFVRLEQADFGMFLRRLWLPVLGS